MPETITDLETAAPEIAETFGSVMEGFTLSKALYTALLLMACIVVVKVLLRLLGRALLRVKGVSDTSTPLSGPRRRSSCGLSRF